VIGKYLFRFGFATPLQWAANEAHDWDDECSEAIFIMADSPDMALSWGQEIAEAFNELLFKNAGQQDDIPSWKEAGFVYWLEESPESIFSDTELKNLPAVGAGELPDFTRWI
jgi:hypothetical protein